MAELIQFLPLLLALIAAGAFAGVLAGLLGVGGGIVLVPAYVAIFSASGYGSDEMMRMCLATSLATIIVTSARSVLAHHRRGAVDWSILREWAPWIAIGAVAGAMTVSRLRTPTLQAIFAVLVFVIALWMLLSRADWRLAAQMPRGAARAALGAVVGFLSTLLGIGGGSLGVPLMTLHGVPIHRAVATAAGFGALIAVPSVATFLFQPVSIAPPGTVGSVNLIVFAITISMTILTAPLGAALAHRANPRRLKRIFALFLLLVALNMLRKALL